MFGLVQNKVDVCFFCETKIDETFLNQQFMIDKWLQVVL